VHLLSDACDGIGWVVIRSAEKELMPCYSNPKIRCKYHTGRVAFIVTNSLSYANLAASLLSCCYGVLTKVTTIDMRFDLGRTELMVG
jgi:hypothetical protein